MSTPKQKTVANEATTPKVEPSLLNDDKKTLDSCFINNWTIAIKKMMKDFEEMSEGLHRPGDRRRKLGSGIRRYGFIDKTSDLALANPQFAPAFFNAGDLKDIVRDIEMSRNLLNLLQQFARLVNDSLLLFSDEAFSMALLYYNSVKELARRNVPGAEAVFRALEPFFRRPRRPGEEPTEPEVERDIRALLHGKKDGKIVVENEKPHLVGGKHVVVDETHKSKAAFKETEEGEIES